MVKSAAIIFIGTGNYIGFFKEWKRCIDAYFLNDVKKELFVFSDTEVVGENVTFNKVEGYKWPWATLYRFKMMLEAKKDLEKFDYVFYVDSDLHPRSDILLEDLTAGMPLVGVHHPGNFVNPDWYTWEDNKASSAFIPGDMSDYGSRAVYFQGCLWGGNSKEVIKLCEELDKLIGKDEELGLVAKWHDESHLNKYLLKNLDNVHVLPFNYAFPEQKEYEHLTKRHKIKMLHLDKSHDEFEYGIAYANNKRTT